MFVNLISPKQKKRMEYEKMLYKKIANYKPDSLRGMQRYLLENKYPSNILSNNVFLFSWNVLEGKARKSRTEEKGKSPNARSISKAEEEEEELLWQNQKLGKLNSTSLVQTMWLKY